MNSRDYLYLAMLGVSALYFYSRGFRQGVLQTRKIWRGLLENATPVNELPPPETQPSPAETQIVLRGSQAFFTTSTIRGSFGRN